MIRLLRQTALALIVLSGCTQAPLEPEGSASVLRIRLMTGAQYTNTLAYVFGEDIAQSIAPPLPPLARTQGLLSVSAASVGVTSDQISQIQQAATFVARKVVDESHRDYLIPCAPSDPLMPDDDCAEAFLAPTGRLLYRKPLSSEQLEELVQIAATAASSTSSFYDGLALALETLLISPAMLYIVDRPDATAAPDGLPQLDAYSIASRLSFFLWNGPPDDALLKAAESGGLKTREGLRKAVDRMLSSRRVELGMRAFFDDMLAFDDFDSLAKDPVVYPMVTATTLAHAREQTLRTIIDHLLTREEDYRDLFITRRTFMSMPLAAIYGTAAQEGWVPHEFDAAQPRPGLLTHVSFLAANSHAVRSSPTLRGKALRERFLCQKVPDPPPNVDFSALEEAGDVPTARERLAVHNENPSCAGCHLITDPMGLSLENFDGAGRFRETENGAELDIRGELDGVFYTDIEGLAQAMRNHPKLSDCLVSRLYAYGTGGPLSLKEDREILNWFEDRFALGAFRLPAILKDIVTSKAFSTVRPPAEPDKPFVAQDQVPASSIISAGLALPGVESRDE